MISIPVWWYVLLCIGAGIFAFGLLLFIIMFVAFLISSSIEERKEIERTVHYYNDPDENPEYIPPEERNGNR